MAYQVDKFNGTFLVSVEDGTIDTTTDLRFVGKNYAGYGEVQNENFLHLLENFANTSAPPKKISGQIWYDSGNKKLKFYDGSKFKVASGAEVSSTAPSGLGTGEFWWDSSAQQLYTWSGTEFVLVGPEASPELGASVVSAVVVKDSLNNNHSIMKLITGGKTIAVVSPDAFTLNSTVNPIEDFTLIKKGITIAKTNSVGVSTDDYVYWGTASNTLKLGGVDAANFVQKGAIVFDNEIGFKDPGLQVGDGNDLRIRVENGDEAIVENRLGNDIIFRITVAEGTDERDVAIMTANGVVPGSNNSFNLGTALLRWNTVYAGTFNGNLTGNVTGDITGVHTGNLRATDTTLMINATTKQIGYDGATIRGNLFGAVDGNLNGTASNASKLTNYSPSISIPAGEVSIPIRDSSGDLYANNFYGVASKSERLRINNAATDDAWNSASASTQYRSAKTTATPYSIAARDASGNMEANLFQGTATAAQYADLAEKYLPDAEYAPGTVMIIGGEKEVTASTWGKRAIGVISTNPAYMMNKDLEGGVYVALKGRVPVKVIGSVKKGDNLIAANDGCAAVGVHHSSEVFAIALESNSDTGTKLVEAVIL
jgi:hypothetical protein